MDSANHGPEDTPIGPARGAATCRWTNSYGNLATQVVSAYYEPSYFICD